VILLARAGESAQALKMAREAIADNVIDFDLANAAFSLAWQAGDFAFAAKAMHLRMDGWPQSRADGYVQLGDLYAKGVKDPAQALDAYKQALALTPEQGRGNLLRHLPPEYLPKLGYANGAPAP